MMASELIPLLESLIEKHGDKEVYLNVADILPQYFECKKAEVIVVSFNFGADDREVLTLSV